MRSSVIALALFGCQGVGSSPPPKPTAPGPAVTAATASPSAPQPSAASPVTALPAASTPPSGAALSVTALRAAQPKASTVHRLRGYVVKRYTCPPCPKGAMCKPCMGDNIVLSDDPKLHTIYDLDDRDVIVFTKAPMNFQLSEQVTLQVRALARQSSNKGIADLELLQREPMQECMHSAPKAGDPCTRPRGRPCTYPSGRKDCGRTIATCADGRWSLDCFE